MLEIVGRSLDPPDNALMLSVDGKPHIQALNRTQPERPLGVDRNTGANFLTLLKHPDRKYPHVRLHLIMENCSAHTSKQVTAWLAKQRKFHVHSTPT